MELRPPTLQNVQENMEESIKLIETSALESNQKLELTLLLLSDKKQGIQLGDSRIIQSESVEERRHWFKKFSAELTHILKVLKELRLEHQIVKNLSEEEDIVSFSVLASKDKKTLQKFYEADRTENDKTFGLMAGFPETAVEAYGTSNALNKEELLPETIDKLRAENLWPFILFTFSQEHFQAELEFVRRNKKLVEEKAPRLSRELLKEQEKGLELDALREKFEKVVDSKGEPIDRGIMETIVIFNAFGFPTSQSCEGHIDLHQERPRSMAPWVEIYPEESEQENWEKNRKLRNEVKAERDKYLSKMANLLYEFYADQNVSEDVRLTTSLSDHGFRVQSKGLNILLDPENKDQQERAKRYKWEMERFTLFLEGKFKKVP